MTPFTRAPWYIQADYVTDDGEYHEPYIYAETPDRATVAIVRIGLSGTDANARLIAAAPALYEALKVAINSVECASINIHDGEELPWYRMARKAIAKAEGLL